MKPQDIIFFIILVILVYKKNSKLAVLIGIIALIISIPLFATWTFFTAERLTWYAAAFFLLSIVFQLKTINKK